MTRRKSIDVNTTYDIDHNIAHNIDLAAVNPSSNSSSNSSRNSSSKPKQASLRTWCFASFAFLSVFGMSQNTASAADAYSTAVLADSPIYYWRLGESDGAATATDATGTLNLAYRTTNTIYEVEGALGSCGDFAAGAPGNTTQSGASVVLDASDPFPTTAFSIEYWVKGTSGASQSIFSYAASGNNNELLLFGYQSLNVYLRTNVGTGISSNDGDWHHMVVTWQSSDGALIVYKDGVSVYTGTFKQGQIISNEGGIYLMQEQDNVGGGLDGAQSLNGSLDEVAIYNTVLTGPQVAAHYSAATTCGANGDPCTTKNDCEGVCSGGVCEMGSRWVMHVPLSPNARILTRIALAIFVFFSKERERAPRTMNVKAR